MLASVSLAGAGLALRQDVGGVTTAAFGFGTLSGALVLVRTGTRFRRVQRALHGGVTLDDSLDALLAWLGVLAVVAGSVVFVLTI